MAPFSMRGNSCGEYIYKGKKFNARKETVKGEEYYGIKIFRFYIKCTRCSTEITFKTDPKNTDYLAEHGASRNFEPWRDIEDKGEAEDPLAHLLGEEEEDQVDPMKSLEQRTLESKREMEIADALQDIRTRNARNERVDLEAVHASLDKGKGKALDAEGEERCKAEEQDEQLVRKYFGRAADQSPEAARPASVDAALEEPIANGENGSAAIMPPPAEAKGLAKAVKRALSDEEPDAASLLSEKARAQLASTKVVAAPPKRRKGNPFGIAKKAKQQLA